MFSKNQASSEVQEGPDRSPESVGAGMSDFTSSVRSKSFAATRGVSSTGRSIVGHGVTITGNIVSKGEVLLEGDVEGDIHCKSLHVGEKSALTGSVVAEEVVLHGRMKGSIHSREVLLKSTAQFEGDINCTSLTVEEGANFLGQSLPSDDPLTNATEGKAQTKTMMSAGPSEEPTKSDAPKEAAE